MPEVIEFEIGEGRMIYAEVEALEEEGRRPVGRGVLSRAKKTFEECMGELATIAEAIDNARQQVVSPAETRVEFGLKISGELGAIIAKTQTEGNIKVSFVWK